MKIKIVHVKLDPEQLSKDKAEEHIESSHYDEHGHRGSFKKGYITGFEKGQKSITWEQLNEFLKDKGLSIIDSKYLNELEAGAI